jgi:hypothetical protein
MRNRNTGFFELDQEGHEHSNRAWIAYTIYMICNTGMYCAKSHQGGSVHLWSTTHSANSGALSAVLAARLAAVLAARLAAVLAARLVAGLAGLVAGARSHILIYTAVRLAANKKNPKLYCRILHLAIYKAASQKKNLMRLQLS